MFFENASIEQIKDNDDEGNIYDVTTTTYYKAGLVSKIGGVGLIGSALAEVIYLIYTHNLSTSVPWERPEDSALVHITMGILLGGSFLTHMIGRSHDKKKNPIRVETERKSTGYCRAGSPADPHLNS
ncbi:hypothetical protein FJZ19_00680 [Candidatus Pacearchaeota archaeon]|nr:hypothetical protein [Candidatus Pacearchaeota archaeon]